ncbi:unnamed protein product [Caenorhabditis nigoni]
MILSKYPLVVQKEILDHMNIIDLLLLSFVSENMKKLVALAQKKRFNRIRSIEYHYDRKDGKCRVYILDEHTSDNKERSSRTWIMEIVDHKEAERAPIHCQLNVSGKMIRFCKYHFWNSYLIASYLECDKESVFQSIHNHFLYIFGNSIKYNWKEPDWNQPQEVFIPYIPKLKNVSFYIGIFVDGHFADVRNLESFFSSSPVAKIVQLRVLKKIEPLNPESKVYQAEGVNVHTPRIMGPDFLRHFQGKQIGLYCRIHEKSSFIDLVNRWKSGKAFQNLEGVYVQMIDDIPPGILNEVGVKFIDANRQPPTHSVRQR